MRSNSANQTAKQQKETQENTGLMLNPVEKEKLRNAVEFMMQKHHGQTRTGGMPYYSHPAAVCQIIHQQGYPLDWQLTALFHDLLEDTDALPEEIEELAGHEVLEAVYLLTKQKGYNMADYTAAIAANPMAKAVKAADRLHNLQSAVVCPESFKRRYILETLDWYLDWHPKIRQAFIDLNAGMDEPVLDEEQIENIRSSMNENFLIRHTISLAE